MAKKLTRAQKLKNPATRSKIPTAKLPGKYQKMRRANAASAKRNDPAALTAPMTPRTLDEQVGASTNLAYGGAEQELAGQQAQSAMIQRQVPQYFADYMNSLKRAETTTAAGYAGAAAINQRATDSTSALDAQAAQQQQAAQVQQSNIQGTTPDPAIAAQAQQASLSRRAAGDSQTRLLGGLGAAQTAYRAGQTVVGAQQQLKAGQDEAERGRTIAAKRVQLAKDKGSYATTTRQKLTDTEHTKQLERKAFGLNAEKAAADVKVEGAKLQQKNVALKQSSADKAADRASRQAIAQANITSRQHEGRLTRLTRKQTARTIATAGNISPTERRRRNTAVSQAEQQREKAVNDAQLYTKHGLKDPAKLRRAIERRSAGAPKEAIDYALAAALGSKAGVTKKGQPTAGARWRKYLQRLAKGELNK